MKKLFWILVIVLIPCCMNSTEKVRVLSFNIRYDNPDDGENAWPHRKTLVTDLVHSQHPDVIGMQEVTYNQLMDLEVMLPEFSWSGVGREDGIQAGEFTPIFYNKSRFFLVEQSTFWLSETPEVPGSISWGAHLPRIVSWIKLNRKNSGEQFFVFNTHFSHVSDSARTRSSGLLLQRIHALAEGYPVILTGDFNFTSNSGGYKILTGTFTGEQGLSDAQSISETPHFGGSSTFNGFGRVENGDKIDFIFVNRYFAVLRHGIFPEHRGGVYISDHYPVYAELEIQESR